MGCVIEPRNAVIAGAEAVVLVECNMAGTVMRGASHPAGVGEQVTRRRIASETGSSRVWPQRRAGGPHREGEEPKPMMYGRGKSDFAIVAVKLANKAAQAVAELVERRAETKGNASRRARSGH